LLSEIASFNAPSTSSSTRSANKRQSTGTGAGAHSEPPSYTSNTNSIPYHLPHPNVYTSGAGAASSSTSAQSSDRSPTTSVTSTESLHNLMRNYGTIKTAPASAATATQQKAAQSNVLNINADTNGSNHNRNASMMNPRLSSTTTAAADSSKLLHPSYHNTIGSTGSAAFSDSEWEEAVVLRDGRRYPIAEREKHVGLLSLFAIIYFCVASGPFGVEEAMRGAG